MDRRRFLTALGLAPFAAQLPGATTLHQPKGRANHCIFIWLGGGMGQIDTFDPKALGDNQSSKKKAGSLYPSIETSVPGMRICELLPRHSRVADKVAILRSMVHSGFCHQQGTQQLLTGHPVRDLKQKPDDPDVLGATLRASAPLVWGFVSASASSSS